MRPYQLPILQWIFCSRIISLFCICEESQAVKTAFQVRAGILNTEDAGILNTEDGGYQHGVRYLIQQKREHVVVAQVNMSNTSLTLVVDHENGTVSLDGDGAVLAPHQKAKLFSLHRWRAVKYGMKDLIARLAGYSADAPGQHAFRLHRIRDRRFKLACLREGEDARAVWMDSNGTMHNVSVVVGSSAGPNYGCMGRCGKGCPKHNKSSVIYTQNCLNHDQCSLESRSRKGMRDKECGEEYKRAMPDYLWGDKSCKRQLRRSKQAALANGMNVTDSDADDDGYVDDGSDDSYNLSEDGYNLSDMEGVGANLTEAEERASEALAIVDEEDEYDDGADQEDLSNEGINTEDLARMIDEEEDE